MAAVKYRVYSSLNRDGPWTLANQTLLDDNPLGNSFNITGLNTNVDYFIRVIGGIIDITGAFIPQIGQTIGPNNDPALGLDSAINIIHSKTFAAKTNTDDILSMEFTVT